MIDHGKAEWRKERKSQARTEDRGIEDSDRRSPCHPVTLSPCHLVTLLSLYHLVTLSPCHLVTQHLVHQRRHSAMKATGRMLAPTHTSTLLLGACGGAANAPAGITTAPAQDPAPTSAPAAAGQVPLTLWVFEGEEEFMPMLKEAFEAKHPRHHTRDHSDSRRPVCHQDRHWRSRPTTRPTSALSMAGSSADEGRQVPAARRAVQHQ